MSDAILYIVIKEGIYIQGIFGIYETLDLAKEALQKAETLESDDYHSLYIINATINKQEEIKNNVIFSTPYTEGTLTVVDRKSGIANLLNDKPIIDR